MPQELKQLKCYMPMTWEDNIIAFAARRECRIMIASDVIEADKKNTQDSISFGTVAALDAPARWNLFYGCLESALMQGEHP